MRLLLSKAKFYYESMSLDEYELIMLCALLMVLALLISLFPEGKALLIIALAISSASLIISKAKVSLPLREITKKKSPWLGELLSCPFCTSVWLALGSVLLYTPALINHPLLNFMSVWLGLVSLAALASGVIIRCLH